MRLLQALSPLLQLLQGVLLLAATWVGAAYLTVCFGAPLLSYWRETASFCLLVVLLTAYPCLLVLGPTPSSLHSLYTSETTDTTPLPATLYLNSVCSLAGAWLGAVPLPLDWDRPWQVGHHSTVSSIHYLIKSDVYFVFEKWTNNLKLSTGMANNLLLGRRCWTRCWQCSGCLQVSHSVNSSNVVI